MGSPELAFLQSLALSFALAIVAIGAYRVLAPTLCLVDMPGGRKDHVGVVPLVGGLGIFTSLFFAAYLLGLSAAAAWFVFGAAVVVAVGLWDDVAEISPRVRFVVQILAAVIMIFGAGVQLRSMGDLLGFGVFGLAAFAVPMTVFAIVGVINAINMMDGMDGLSGSVALVAFTWYALVAADSGLATIFSVAVVMCGGLLAFLVFNLRFPWQPRAVVFMGDAGSLMLGFALGWLAVDLTQGPGRTFPPIAALWVILLPLADCVSLMARRVREGRSPFSADRHHIHHYLQARGFSHGATLAFLVGLATCFGAVGYLGWKLAVPEALLFWTFFFGFFTYHFWIGREWKRIDAKAVDKASEIRVGQDEAVARA
jgi:UDP-GlcNAc:undecaprenyl-phosphate GlcNAc-1-phosphate transferase